MNHIETNPGQLTPDEIAARLSDPAVQAQLRENPETVAQARQILHENGQAPESTPADNVEGHDDYVPDFRNYDERPYYHDGRRANGSPDDPRVIEGAVVPEGGDTSAEDTGSSADDRNTRPQGLAAPEAVSEEARQFEEADIRATEAAQRALPAAATDQEQLALPAGSTGRERLAIGASPDDEPAALEARAREHEQRAERARQQNADDERRRAAEREAAREKGEELLAQRRNDARGVDATQELSTLPGWGEGFTDQSLVPESILSLSSAEKALAAFGQEINNIAKLKMELESRVGWGRRAQERRLMAAQLDLKRKIRDYSRETGESSIDLNVFVNEAIAAERIEIAPEEVKGWIPKVGQGINEFVRYIAKHKKILGVVAIALVAGLGLGLAGGAGAAMIAAAKFGAVSGGILGVVKSFFGSRADLAEDNLRTAVETRTKPEMDWHGSSLTYRKTMGKLVLGKMLKGTAVSSAGGALGAAGAVGLGSFINGLFDGEAMAMKQLPTDVQVPGADGGSGLEGLDLDANTDAAAARFDSYGDYLWTKLQSAGDLSNADTFNTIVGDGANNGGLEELAAKGIEVKMGGGAEMVNGDIQFDGSPWWAQDTHVSAETFPNGITIVDPNNVASSLQFGPGEHLSNNQLAAALDLMSKGGEVVPTEQFNGMDLGQLQNAAMDRIANDIATEVSKVSDSGDTVNGLAIESQQQAAVQSYISGHEAIIDKMPANELAAKIANTTDVPQGVIVEMINKAQEQVTAVHKQSGYVLAA